MIRMSGPNSFQYDILRANGCYALCAFPAEYGISGENTYVINEEGSVFSMDLGTTKFIGDYPTNSPLDIGWTIAE